MVELAAGFLIAWVILTSWWMGKVLACMESIAESLLARRGE